MTESGDDVTDRIVIEMDPGGPIELDGLTESFAALARLYARHHGPKKEGELSPKLYVTRLESGSIVAEIAPYLPILAALVYSADSALVVADFTRRVGIGIRAFASPIGATSAPPPADERPSREDAYDLKEFLRPLAGHRNARLEIRHARIERDGDRVVAEYDFDEAQINRASVNIDAAISSGTILSLPAQSEEDEQTTDASIVKEVILFFEQASRKPGKESGRTGDKGVIPDISEKAMPVYFRKSIQNLKELMVRGEANPLTNIAFVVDVHVQKVDGKPKAYLVTNVHETMQLGSE